MIHRPELSSIRGLHVAAQLPSWKGVDELLTNELNAVFERMTESPDAAALYRLQGRAQLIKEIRKLAATSADLMEKLEPKRS